MHAKTNSEVTSLASSSSDHNRRPVYYVQSPSHDGDKTATTMTTALSSQMGSPPNSHSSSVGHHSRDSSTSSCIAREISQNGVGSWGRVEETGPPKVLLCDAIEARQGCVLRFVVWFLVLFSLLSLILWGATRSHKPKIAINSIKFGRFEVRQGLYGLGFPTYLIFINSTVKLTFINNAKSFGVHVTSTPLTLNYFNLPIGSGNMEKFYQPKNKVSTIVVIVNGEGIPLFGAGYDLWTWSGTTTKPLPLNLEFTVRSSAYVVGKLVKSTFYQKIECSIVFNLKKLNATIPVKNSCT